MDGGTVTPSKVKSFSEVFREQCPVYMSIGMSYDEFWNGTPRMCESYRKAHNLKQDETNFYLWLQGYYDYMAVSTALGNAFKGKGSQADPYLKEPIRLREKTKREMEADQERKNNELVAKLNAMQKRWVSKHKGDVNGS